MAMEEHHQRRGLPARTTSSLISFASNDYLGLSQHPDVIEAGRAALLKFGAGAGASRLITGNHPFYEPLEALLARMKGKEAALVFGSGYLANIGVIPALVGKGDLILADKLIHACMVDGAKLSGAMFKRFRHNDIAHAEALLDEHRAQFRHTMILVDHVYSMDGDIAPLRELAALARKYDCWLMADDAHGFGIVKPEIDVDIWMGTLSKAVGCYGGYIAASKVVVNYMLSSARSFIFSTGLPPATCASALAALEIIAAEPQLAAQVLMYARRIQPQAQSAIVPIMLGSEARALAAAAVLQTYGLHAVAIRPPTVPANSARLRLTFSVTHRDTDITQLHKALEKEGLLP